MASQLRHLEDAFSGDHWGGVARGVFRRPIQNHFEVVHRWILDQQFAEEAIELGFRERVGPFHFEWVLRRHDEERFGEFMGCSRDRDRMFLHRFEQSRLGFWGSSIDLVG